MIPTELAPAALALREKQAPTFHARLKVLNRRERSLRAELARQDLQLVELARDVEGRLARLEARPVAVTTQRWAPCGCGQSVSEQLVPLSDGVSVDAFDPSVGQPHVECGIESWGTEHVASWLGTLDLLAPYGDLFRSHEVDGPTLASLDREKLVELGIWKFGHLHRLSPMP